MHPLSARLFGFKSAIAHGMWTKARCLARAPGPPARRVHGRGGVQEADLAARQGRVLRGGRGRRGVRLRSACATRARAARTWTAGAFSADIHLKTPPPPVDNRGQCQAAPTGDLTSERTPRAGPPSAPGKVVCVLELASMLAGDRFGDRPVSVCPVIGAILRAYNDNVDDRRRQDLYRFAADAVGTRRDYRVQRHRADAALDWALARYRRAAARSWRRPIPRARATRSPTTWSARSRPGPRDAGPTTSTRADRPPRGTDRDRSRAGARRFDRRAARRRSPRTGRAAARARRQLPRVHPR